MKRTNRTLVALVIVAFPFLAFAEVEIPRLTQIQTFSYEDKDWGVAPASSPQGPPFGKPTPTSIPGARVIRTLELKALLDADKGVVVIDVLDSKTRTTIPGAYWMPGAGDSRFFGAKRRFSATLEKLVAGDKNRPIAFLCLSSECWESYNACLHAIEAGYKDILWYRGGTNAWGGANLDRKTPERVNW
jgi:PQQ-dependent catabolism-associated CXXCW motif protein